MRQATKIAVRPGKLLLFVTSCLLLAACGGGSSGSGAAGGATNAGFYEGVGTTCVNSACSQVITALLIHADGRVIVDPNTGSDMIGSMTGINTFEVNAGPRQISFLCEQNGFGTGQGSLKIDGTINGNQVTESLTGSVRCANGISATLSGSGTLTKTTSLSKVKKPRGSLIEGFSSF